jgi:hypothetical protein
MQNASQYGTPVSATATHATAAVATLTAVVGQRYFISDVGVSSDKAGAIMLIKQGTTVIWQLQVGAGNFAHHFEAPLRGDTGALVSAEIDGTSACKANINAYIV